jgi:hypothetical protein
MSQGLPIPKVNALAERSLVSSSPDWRSAAPGSVHRDDIKGSWQGVTSGVLRPPSLNIQTILTPLIKIFSYS